MKRVFRVTLALVAALLLGVTPQSAFAQPLGANSSVPGPMAELQRLLSSASARSSWNVAIEVKDLATGLASGVNGNASMPAASTIKIPVMVEVFRQMELGLLDLRRTVHVQRSDKDYGSGALCDAVVGSPVSVEQLLWAMITESDNTATNMLIRLAGRQRINQTMRDLGLKHTTLGDYIRTYDGNIRYTLRTSPHDMILLLDAMAHHTLIDQWASGEMLSILTGQRHNSLLPQPLPPGTQVAHKTGTLHDTLNDVGIVYLADEPYVIAVMTTNLPNLESGRNFIRHVSRITYDSFKRLAIWRERYGLPAFVDSGPLAKGNRQVLAPDVAMWNSHSGNAAASDGGVWKNPNFVP